MDNLKIEKTIMFSGGGTGGSVTPLLAVAEKLIGTADKTAYRLVFVGTASGPEREMINHFNAASGAAGGQLEFISLPSGKLRRYFSLANLGDIFRIMTAFLRSGRILKQYRPAIVISAGSFVSAPLVWAAAGRKIPILIHQQDVRPGLANKLMAPFARVISVTFEKSLSDYGSRAVLTGNPFSETDKNRVRSEAIKAKYGLDGNRPLIVVIGGATGATAINKLISQAIGKLSVLGQIIHITGAGKAIPTMMPTEISGYQAFEFLDHEEFLSLLALADLVVSRAGLGILTELSALNKPVILIPMPNSHQEDNAAVLAKAEAAVILEQKGLTPEKLTAEIERVLHNSVLKENLSKNIGTIIKRGAAETIAGLIKKIIE
jgi:UDP-N-acetylglucosamine--N-acetylmuramyl-(pentapeptide) pyrophosphoryl-undecaprenol N-acetylglucosamine transferase